MNIAYNIDCMEFMKTLPDKAFELAIVDPPYGIGEDGGRLKEYNSKQGRKPKEYTKKNWDNATPNKEYFLELQRVSVNQIIWGGNYFSDMLNPTGSWVVWDKQVVMPTFSDGEMAWCSMRNSLKIARFLWAGYRKCEETERFHPTQKPVKLYEWLLTHYAKQGDKILDTHLGSGSSRIAAYNLGFDFVGCEIDEDYFKAQEERFARHTAQGNLFLELENGSRSRPNQLKDG